MERLQEFYEGNISAIEELEEKQLDFQGDEEVFRKEHILYNSWGGSVTANVVS